MPVATRSFHTGVATTAGSRAINQDAYHAGGPWYVVADGVGGHRSGEVAAGLAVAAFADAPPPHTVADITDLVAGAHRSIIDVAQRHDTTDMATTLVGAVPIDDRVAVFHVGDSRCYRYADGVLSLLTRDHSLVEELVAAGRLEAADAVAHPNRHVISRALGLAGANEADVRLLPITPMRLLLCSDGVSDTLAPASIGRVLAGIADPQQAAERMVELASNGTDNATAVVVDVVDGADTDPAAEVESSEVLAAPTWR